MARDRRLCALSCAKSVSLREAQPDEIISKLKLRMMKLRNLLLGTALVCGLIGLAQKPAHADEFALTHDEMDRLCSSRLMTQDQCKAAGVQYGDTTAQAIQAKAAENAKHCTDLERGLTLDNARLDATQAMDAAEGKLNYDNDHWYEIGTRLGNMNAVQLVINDDMRNIRATQKVFSDLADCH